MELDAAPEDQGMDVEAGPIVPVDEDTVYSLNTVKSNKRWLKEITRWLETQGESRTVEGLSFQQFLLHLKERTKKCGKGKGVKPVDIGSLRQATNAAVAAFNAQKLQVRWLPRHTHRHAQTPHRHAQTHTDTSTATRTDTHTETPTHRERETPTRTDTHTAVHTSQLHQQRHTVTTSLTPALTRSRHHQRHTRIDFTQ